MYTKEEEEVRVFWVPYVRARTRERRALISNISLGGRSCYFYSHLCNEPAHFEGLFFCVSCKVKEFKQVRME